VDIAWFSYILLTPSFLIFGCFKASDSFHTGVG